MRLVLLSDTHGHHSKLQVPDGDILIHAGDMTGHGDFPEIEAAGNWLQSLPHKHKLIIAGNHDFGFEVEGKRARKCLGDKTQGILYLRDSGTEIGGLRFWGSPWQPLFYDWAFNLPRGKPLADKWALIPEKTDVLITHGPPWGILDLTHRGQCVGDQDLLDRVSVVKPRVHVFGHIHEARGREDHDGTMFLNVATDHCRHEPVVLDLEPR